MVAQAMGEVKAVNAALGEPLIFDGVRESHRISVAVTKMEQRSVKNLGGRNKQVGFSASASLLVYSSCKINHTSPAARTLNSPAVTKSAAVNPAKRASGDP